jgi:hypothetical protein
MIASKTASSTIAGTSARAGIWMDKVEIIDMTSVGIGEYNPISMTSSLRARYHYSSKL